TRFRSRWRRKGCVRAEVLKAQAYREAASDPGGFFVPSGLAGLETRLEKTMAPHTDDLRIESLKPLAAPAAVIEELPCTEAMSDTVSTARRRLHDILHGHD